jgi:hypothetical protein
VSPASPTSRIPPRSSFRRSALTFAALALTGAAAVLAAILVSGERHPITPLCQVVAPSGRYQLSLDQAANAATIAAVGKAAGLPDHAVTVALAAAMQESKLHNLAGGDRDSVGLFQQRPSQGWGTPTQLRQPSYAAAAFFAVLRTVPGWQSMPVTEAAQLVQRSATPDAYAAWAQEARAIAEALTGETPGGLACQFTATSPAPAASALAAAMKAELGSTAFTASDAASQWLVATWLVAHASIYQLTSVEFGTYRWVSTKAVWTSAHADRAQLAVTVAGRRGLVTASAGV